MCQFDQLSIDDRVAFLELVKQETLRGWNIAFKEKDLLPKLRYAIEAIKALDVSMTMSELFHLRAFLSMHCIWNI